VLWRQTSDHLEVALVHRPKYDDWSLPKGKLHSGEHPVHAALREVAEETGHTAVAGRPLGQAAYPVWGALKRVRYWAMQATGGRFRPNHEVDALEWLGIEAALERLDHGRDRRVLAAFAADPVPTRAWILVRHAQAGERLDDPDQDRLRPLDAHGRLQAQVLAAVLAAYGIQRVVAADVRRCLETVGLYACQAGLVVEPQPLFSPHGQASAPQAAVRQLLTSVHDRRSSVVCSQCEAIPDLMAALCMVLDLALPAQPELDKGAYWVLHLDAASVSGRVVGLEHGQPLAPDPPAVPQTPPVRLTE